MRTFILQVAFLLCTTLLFGTVRKESGDCDTLFMTNGEVILVENLTIGSRKLTYTHCADIQGKYHVTHRADVLRIAVAEDTVIEHLPGNMPDEAEVELAIEKLKKLNVVAAFGLLFAPAVFVAFSVLRKGKKLLKRIKGHPKEAEWRKQIVKSRITARIILALFLILYTLLIGLAIASIGFELSFNFSGWSF